MKKSKVNQVGNFEQLVSFINAQGAVYNPSKASIKGAALQTLLTQAQGAMKAADVSRNAIDNAINARQQVFRTIPSLAGRIVVFLELAGASPEVIDECKAIKRRFNSQGSRSENRAPVSQSFAPDQPGEKVSRRISYLDKESMIQNFERFVNKAIADPVYKPNETELQAATLVTLIATMRTRNKAVKDAFVALREAELAFNKTLYGTLGIHGQASAVKKYVRVVYGFRSPQHKEVSKLDFSND
jgi:hypothetical protein